MALPSAEATPSGTSRRNCSVLPSTCRIQTRLSHDRANSISGRERTSPALALPGVSQIAFGIIRVTVIPARAAEPGVLSTTVPVCWQNAIEPGSSNPIGKTILASVTGWTLTNFNASTRSSGLYKRAGSALCLCVGQRVRIKLRVAPTCRRADLRARKSQHAVQICAIEFRAV